MRIEGGYIFNPKAYNKNKDSTKDRRLLQVNYQHNKKLMHCSKHRAWHQNTLLKLQALGQLGDGGKGVQRTQGT